MVYASSVMRTGIAAACTVVLLAGGCRPHHYRPQVEWPPSASVDLGTGIAAEKPGEGDVPGLLVHEGEAAGFHYLEVVLGDADPDAEMPLILALHGRGDRPRVPGWPFMALPAPVRVVMPRAPMRQGDGFAWLPVTVGEGKLYLLSTFLDTMAGRLANLIDDIRGEHPAKGKTIVTGFSQGGIMAFAIAVTHPLKVGAAFPMAGWLPPPLVPLTVDDPSIYPPIHAMHGVDDEIIPVGPTRESVETLKGMGLDVELVEFAGVKHEMTEEMNSLFHGWLSEAVAREAGIEPPAADDDGVPAPAPPEVPDTP